MKTPLSKKIKCHRTIILNNLNFKENSIIPKFDDFYWDIKIRCEKINENIDKLIIKLKK